MYRWKSDGFLPEGLKNDLLAFEWNQTFPLRPLFSCKPADCFHTWKGWGGCRGSERMVFPLRVPTHVWVIGTLIRSMWRCPFRRQQFASAPASRSGCNLAPRQHDLNPAVSFASPTVTARWLEKLTCAGLRTDWQNCLNTIDGIPQRRCHWNKRLKRILLQNGPNGHSAHFNLKSPNS